MAHLYKGPGYKRGKKPLKVWREYCNEETEHFIRTYPSDMVDEAKYVAAQELGESMIGRYLDLYGLDPHWYIIEPESTFAFPLLPGLDYNGTFDLVYRDEKIDFIKLEEHKTAKAISTGHLPMDDQAGGYWAVAETVLRASGKIGKRERLDGIEYNFVRKALPDLRPTNEQGLYLNKDGSISKVQPPAHFLRHWVPRTPKERAHVLKHARDEAAQMADIDSGVRNATKNPTMDCSWQCPFTGLCELHEAGADWKEYAEQVYRIEDPYADHRKSA